MELLLAIDFTNLHTVLEGLYDEMMPLCEDMLDIGKGLAGLGALFYVASRVWQSLARAEPIDVYPLLRPFAIGICILLFPTLVLGTLNEGLGLIVQGTHTMVEEQTLDMERYRAQKDELEREAMMRSPETAFLVSDEEFDRQLDELGWTPGDMATRLGMYVEVGMYNMEKKIRDAFRSLLELLFAAARVGRFPVNPHPMVRALHLRLPVAARERPVQLYARENPSADAPERHSRAAKQPGVFNRQLEQRVHSVHAHRHNRLLHRPDRGELDSAGRRSRQLQPKHQPQCCKGRRTCGRKHRLAARQRRRKVARKVTHAKLEVMQTKNMK